MDLLDLKQTKAVVNELDLTFVHNVLVCYYVLHPAERKSRDNLNALFSNGLPMFTHADWRVSVCVFTPKAVYLAIRWKKFARFNPRDFSGNVQIIPRNSISHFTFGIDSYEPWRVTFDYNIDGTHTRHFYGLFGGYDDNSDNERTLKYLASNGFYYLMQPFKADSYRDLRTKLSDGTIILKSFDGGT